MILYEAFDKKTKKYYVGITKRTLSQRKREHLFAKGNGKFHDELRKRPGDFEWSVVFSNIETLEEALVKERERIKERNSFIDGYNGTEGGDYHPSYNGIYQKGRRWSETEKERMSKQRKGKGKGENNAMAKMENRLKISKALKGREKPDLIAYTRYELVKISSEVQRELSERMKGDKNIAKTPEVREKISKAVKGGKNGYAKKCKIVELDLEFECYSYCAKFLGVSVTMVSNAIKYSYRTKGYHIIKI